MRPAAAALAFAALCAPLLSRAGDDALEPLTGAIAGSMPLVNLRLRSETVGQDGFADDAEALTLRARLGFETGSAWGTSLLAEANLDWPLDTRYNSTTNHRIAYPVVADPEDYALDRLQLTNTALPGTRLIVGRQRIDLDDQRFVGSVAFRQNEQTFDSARIINTSIPGVTFDLTYLDRVHRVFGHESPVGQYSGSSYLANVAWRTPLGVLTGYGYWLDFHQDHPDSTRTLGARLVGTRTVDDWTIQYSGAYAHQAPYADNALRFSADYYMAGLALTYAGVSLGGGVEVMGGNGVKGFTTPLATLHKFDGWADVFLTTPVDGIADRYASAGYAVRRIAF